MTVLGIDIDVREDYLEDHWDDEAKCEWTHPQSECSVEVAYRCISTCDGKSELWCSAAWQEVQITAWQVECTLCHRDLLTCWAVQPA